MFRPFFWTSVLSTSFLVTTEFWKDVWGGYHWSMPLLAFLAAGFVEVRGTRQNLETERQKFTINKFVEAEFARLRENDATARLNVMLTLPLLSKQRLFAFRKARALTFFERIGFADGDPDRELVIFEKEGVAGMVLHHELPAIGMRDSSTIVVGKNQFTYNDVDCNMEQAIRDKAKAAKMRIIFSYPIRELRKDGVSVLDAGKVIGVINCDSQMTWEDWKKQIDPEDFMNKRLPVMAKAVAYALA